MKQHEVRALTPGIYRIEWKANGGHSIAAVGVTADGGRWIAPINWIAPSTDQKSWRMVDEVARQS